MREFMYDINSVFIAGVLLVSMVLAIEAGCTFPFELRLDAVGREEHEVAHVDVDSACGLGGVAGLADANVVTPAGSGCPASS